MKAGNLYRCVIVIDPQPVAGLYAVTFQQSLSKWIFERTIQQKRGWYVKDGYFHAPPEWTDYRKVPREIPLGVSIWGYFVTSLKNMDVDYLYFWDSEKGAKNALKDLGWHQHKGQWSK